MSDDDSWSVVQPKAKGRGKNVKKQNKAVFSSQQDLVVSILQADKEFEELEGV